MSCNSTGISLTVKNVSYGPSAGLTLIHNISFAIEAGDRLAIIGPNGAGKSTLLRCLFRAIKPTAGEIILDDLPLWSQAPREVARKVAVVLQEMPADFPFSVRDVVMMGRIPRREGLGGWSDKDRFEVEHAMEHLHLQKLARRQFSSLSGGEKQRVLVARALAQEPELILLDEPTNHLDIRHQLEILAMLRGLGLTIVTSLHDINLAADFATHVAIMEHGRMTGFGCPDDVMTPSAISSAFGIAALAHRSDAPGATRFSFELHS